MKAEDYLLHESRPHSAPDYFLNLHICAIVNKHFSDIKSSNKKQKKKKSVELQRFSCMFFFFVLFVILCVTIVFMA